MTSQEQCRRCGLKLTERQIDGYCDGICKKDSKIYGDRY